jgi:Opioid growth factor receptor (OGFr) conserved region
MNKLIAFYNGDMVHPDGYTLDGILAEDDHWLEAKHTYIQWLFPLNKPSEAVPGSPVISEGEVELFRTSTGLKQNLMRSFQRMLQFYGFRLAVDSDDYPFVDKAPSFEKRKSEWLTPYNHNYLRISRILESLTLLGLPDMALIFFAALRELYQDNPSSIGSTTYGYWERSIKA